MKVVITGGSGFVGCRVIPLLLQSSHSVTVLTRTPNLDSHPKLKNLVASLPSEQQNRISLALWDPSRVTDELTDLLSRSDAIIHLAGTNILAKRWTDTFKHQVEESRVISTRVLVNAMRTSSKRPTVMVSASGVGAYGECGDEEIDESHPFGNDFLARVCVEWEAEAKKAEELGVRVCIARIGGVLGPEGGALEQMIPLFSWRVGGHAGNGQNYFSWIHGNDCARAFIHLIENEEATGAFNMVAPNPVTMATFCQTLGQAMNRWSWAHAPYFAVRILLGEAADVVVQSDRCKPSALEASQFEFQHPDLLEALKDLHNESK